MRVNKSHADKPIIATPTTVWVTVTRATTYQVDAADWAERDMEALEGATVVDEETVDCQEED